MWLLNKQFAEADNKKRKPKKPDTAFSITRSLGSQAQGLSEQKFFLPFSEKRVHTIQRQWWWMGGVGSWWM